MIDPRFSEYFDIGLSIFLGIIVAMMINYYHDDPVSVNVYNNNCKIIDRIPDDPNKKS